MPPGVWMSMGLVITPLRTPRRFNPLNQPLATAQKLGGRELVWRFDGGDITSDGGVLMLQKLEERAGIVRRFAACFTDYRTPLRTPRRFNPLNQPLATAQKLGGRELVWRFDGGDITSDGGVLM